jgi:hypothetical protein
MERCPIYILQPPASWPASRDGADGARVLQYLLINRNHDDGHQPHIALGNDSPLCAGNTWGKYVQRDRRAECHVNLHHRRMIIIKSMAPKGAYCRIMALKLMLRAALRYFSDSERSELDKCDIPRTKSKSFIMDYVPKLHRNTYGQVNLLATITPPYFWSLF